MCTAKKQQGYVFTKKIGINTWGTRSDTVCYNAQAAGTARVKFRERKTKDKCSIIYLADTAIRGQTGCYS